MRVRRTRELSPVAGGLLAVLATLLCDCTHSPGPIPPPTAELSETGQAAPSPAGFVSFCVRFPEQCQAPADPGLIVRLNEQSWRLLNSVNRTVNDDIWPEDDARHYGRAEYWTIPSDGYGDCDDYALTKRKKLLDAGLPESALRIAVVFSEQSGRHAVLTVTTDRGDLVLDNLSDRIMPWNETAFVWIERQAGADPMQWRWLSPMTASLQALLPTAQSERR